jgi:mannose-6-phosphate isomerase
MFSRETRRSYSFVCPGMSSSLCCAAVVYEGDAIMEATVGEKDERPWGRYEVLEERDGFKVKRLEVNPGARLSLQRHSRRSEHWVVVAGRADVVCGERELQLEKGAHIYLPAETNHRLGNSSDQPLVLIEVQLGDYLGEDDIIRLADDYKR